MPFDLSYVAGRIFENIARALEVFLFGVGSDGAWMLPPLLGIAALFGMIRIARHRPLTALLPLLWLILIFAAISTLDTAGWHFRRYQMPLLALAFPLTAHAAVAISVHPRSRARLVGYTLILSVFLNQIFVAYHVANVESVAAQPLAMARWIAENTPPDSLIAVHDVGLIRYLGGRNTLDMVGLTTPGMADAWRNGPGAVGEALITASRRPDYIAAYDDARGLSYIADSLVGQLLAGFRHEFNPVSNVALGGQFQGIYQPTWDGTDAALEPRVDAVRAYLEGFTLTDTLNVAELSSEHEHHYTWHNLSHSDGFASEVYLLNVPGCSTDCRVLDGGRRMNGGESFALAARPGHDHILVSRYHASNGGVIRVVINDSYTVERTLPSIPGQFIEVPVLIPAEQVTASTLHVRLEPVAGALILPYRHWLYEGIRIRISPDAAVMFQNGARANASSVFERYSMWTSVVTGTPMETDRIIHLMRSSKPRCAIRLRLVRGIAAGTAPGRRSDRIVLDLEDSPVAIQCCCLLT